MLIFQDRTLERKKCVFGRRGDVSVLHMLKLSSMLTTQRNPDWSWRYRLSSSELLQTAALDVAGSLWYQGALC